MVGDELEASLLEAADAGELTLPHQHKESPSPVLPADDDQVVPKEEKVHKYIISGLHVIIQNGRILLVYDYTFGGP